MSKDICGDLCEKGAICSESGACICSKEPVSILRRLYLELDLYRINIKYHLFFELLTTILTYTVYIYSSSNILFAFQGASSLGGQFTHCTNWNYVDQKECQALCDAVGKNDHRVCWTSTIGNYCTCYDTLPMKP